MGLGLKATIPLVFVSFLRGLVRVKSILKLLADPRNLWGFGGTQKSKKSGIDGFGPRGKQFSALFEGFG